MNPLPTIDVVIPIYNTEKFILQALDSVVAQTLPPRKIIVVDDGSTDNSHVLVEEYKTSSPIEILLIKKENGGLSSARNAGVQASDADFIAFLDADDVWLPSKLEEQIKVYNSSNLKNLGLVYCNYDVIDVSGAIKYKNYKAPLDKKRMRGNVFKFLLERNRIASSGSGVLIKREVFDVVGLFDETLRWGEDWDMWLRIAERYEVDFVEDILVHIRKHGQNMTANRATVFERELYFYSKWISRLEGKRPIPAFWSDKITFRVLARLPKRDFIRILRKSMTRETYKKLFRKSLGSFFLYIPIFIIRQVYNVLFTPKYLHIASQLVRYRGR